MAKLKVNAIRKKNFIDAMMQRSFENWMMENLFEKSDWSTIEELDRMVGEYMDQFFLVRAKIEEYYQPLIEEEAPFMKLFEEED